MVPGHGCAVSWQLHSAGKLGSLIYGTFRQLVPHLPQWSPENLRDHRAAEGWGRDLCAECVRDAATQAARQKPAKEVDELIAAGREYEPNFLKENL
jgi:hypothetical protein